MSLPVCFRMGLFCLLAVSIHAKDYEIRFFTPKKVGDKFSVDKSAEVSNDMAISMGDQVVNKKKVAFTAKFAGEMKVLKLDDLKRPIEMELTVDALIRKSAGGEEVASLPKGSIVILTKRLGHGVFLIDGKKASKDVSEILALFFSIPKTKVVDDDIFGTKDRKKVGDSWPINAAVAMKDLTSEGLNIEDLKGTVKLEKTFKIDGVECLHVSVEMRSDKYRVPLPPAFIVKKSVMKLSVNGEMIAEPGASQTGLPLKGDMNMEMSLVAEGKAKPQSPFMRLSVESKRRIKGVSKRIR